MVIPPFRRIQHHLAPGLRLLNENKRLVVLAGTLLFLMVLFSVDWARGPWETSDTGHLPKLWNTEPLPDRAAVISVSESCLYRVSTGEDMSLPAESLNQVGTFVDLVRSKNPESPFIVNAHSRAKYTCVDDLFRLLKDHGISNVYLYAQQKTKPYTR